MSDAGSCFYQPCFSIELDIRVAPYHDVVPLSQPIDEIHNQEGGDEHGDEERDDDRIDERGSLSAVRSGSVSEPSVSNRGDAILAQGDVAEQDREGEHPEQIAARHEPC